MREERFNTERSTGGNLLPAPTPTHTPDGSFNIKLLLLSFFLSFFIKTRRKQKDIVFSGRVLSRLASPRPSTGCTLMRPEDFQS